jgi:hypothetical protein
MTFYEFSASMSRNEQVDSKFASPHTTIDKTQAALRAQDPMPSRALPRPLPGTTLPGNTRATIQ